MTSSDWMKDSVPTHIRYGESRILWLAAMFYNLTHITIVSTTLSSLGAAERFTAIKLNLARKNNR